jgi:hypothetical protein
MAGGRKSMKWHEEKVSRENEVVEEMSDIEGGEEEKTSALKNSVEQKTWKICA